MKRDRYSMDYEPVTRSKRARLWAGEAAGVDGLSQDAAEPADQVEERVVGEHLLAQSTATRRLKEKKKGGWSARRGHAPSYAGLFLFTVILYFRPYELFPPLSSFSSMAFWVAILTLIIFIPSQFALEGTLTARPREVHLILLLCLAGLLSIPFAIVPREAWETFSDTFIRAVLMFIVMINVVRTERRLKGLILLALTVGCVLSVAALNDYRLGRFSVEGYRVSGLIGGMFQNPNDMALHLVMMTPLAITLFLNARGPFKKALYGGCAGLLVAGNVVTFSRGGFLGLIAAAIFLAWKLGRQQRLGVAAAIFVVAALFLVFAPGNYAVRLLSIFDPSLDAVGSAIARRALLTQSLIVALRHPLFGVGMGNFHIVSVSEHVSHNAYTQVAAETGVAALVIYVMFIVEPLRRLRRIEFETFTARRFSPFYYLAVGLQASLVGYMVSSFFVSVAYEWYIYYLVGYAVCLRRIYQSQPSATADTIAAGRTETAEDRAGGHSHTARFSEAEVVNEY